MSQPTFVVILSGPEYKSRIEEGSRVYLATRPPKFLIFTSIRSPERYKAYRQEFKRNGISMEEIIIDPQARDTIDNVINSYEIIEDLGYDSGNIIVVTSDYHAQRAFLLFREYFSHQDFEGLIEVIPVSSGASPSKEDLEEQLITTLVGTDFEPLWRRL